VSTTNKVLIGLVVDVSSSMQKNWYNKFTRNKNRIEVLRDALNSEFRRLRLLHSSVPDSEICVFCLGIGFKIPFNLISVDLSDGGEKELPDSKDTINIGVICDLLSLSEIVPSEKKLSMIRNEIQRFWDQKSAEFVSDWGKNNSIPELERRIFTGLLDIRIGFNSPLHRLLKSLSKKLDEKIFRARVSHLTGRFRKDVEEAANSIFLERKEHYLNLIDDKLSSFAAHQIQIMLDRNSLGFSIETVLRNFDLDKMNLLADSIYQEIKKDMEASTIR